MLYLKALVLSLIQALTEFIPVSSSGHLIIFGNYLKFNSVDAALFNAIIQLASTIAIIIFFRKKSGEEAGRAAGTVGRCSPDHLHADH